MKYLILVLAICLVPSLGQTSDHAGVPSPTAGMLKKLSKDDLFRTNPLMEWMSATVEGSPGQLYEDKVLFALKNSIPKKAGFYFVMFQVDGQFGNGGMQQVLLQDPIPQNQELLKIAVEAFKAFGAERTSALLMDLVPKAKKWMERLESLEKQNADDSEFDKVYSEVDNYDRKYEKAIKWDKDPFKALIHDIKKNPKAYIVTND